MDGQTDRPIDQLTPDYLDFKTHALQAQLRGSGSIYLNNLYQFGCSRINYWGGGGKKGSGNKIFWLCDMCKNLVCGSIP